MTEKKDNRCRPGYEPAKKKKPNSQGSCRPKAESKLTPAEKEFRAARRRQLDRWEEEHPGVRRSASQHLRAPAHPKPSGRRKTKAGSGKDNRKR